MIGTNDHTAIIGAGIGGLTLAAALGRRNWDFQVYEQAPQLGEVGAGIQLTPNAVLLLHRLGLRTVLEDSAVTIEALEMRRWSDGRVLRSTRLGAEAEELFGAPYYAVHRADLHSALLGLVDSERIRLNSRCIGVEERADSVTLSFADGHTTTAGLVVGADGIHSRVRAELLDDRPQFSGESIYRGLVPADGLSELAEERKVVIWLGPGQHLVCYPVSAGKQISFAATAPAGEWYEESWSAEGSVADLLAAYDGWDPTARDLLAAADRTSRWALHDRDIAERWTSTRLAVLGDAAHPMLPFFAQGATQAIEDAAALAVCLAEAGPGPNERPRALARYAEVRRHRTDEVHRISRGNSTMLHLPDGEEQRRRDTAMAASADPRSQEWLYGYDAEKAPQAVAVQGQNATKGPTK
ncbi:FAD-dependent monooxygenase [Actinacidiphila paucisporea]|uniref:Salicylate hydroxylase n=1 Tax=Actinacidiphila paucisporea TaxID=310782 RepID=A0A1M7Q7M0_9ACTN|nr:FAD-dependent monooxygenase [Actinacidiphila paucisporea]SHN26568.1 salicylate hydroxylase [Actinacidiphila paucisporea]